MATTEKMIRLGMIEPNLKASGRDKKLDPKKFLSKLKTVDPKVADGFGPCTKLATFSATTSKVERFLSDCGLMASSGCTSKVETNGTDFALETNDDGGRGLLPRWSWFGLLGGVRSGGRGPRDGDICLILGESNAS